MSASSRVPTPAPWGTSFVEQTPPERLQDPAISKIGNEERVRTLVEAYIRELSHEAVFLSGCDSSSSEDDDLLPRRSQALKKSITKLVTEDPNLQVAFARLCLDYPRILSLDPTMSTLLPKISRS
jgi:hypothetical protein